METVAELTEATPHSQEQYSPVAKMPGQPVLQQAARFIREHRLKMAAISTILLAPCFWHRRIEAGDLGSHMYNAWLAQLIERGQAPGLWIARQWNNILFDLALTRLGSIFGWRVAERIVVAVAVLVFFWGAFALICAAARRAPWFLVPCIAMVTYGWTFNMGFFNFYVALGLSFFALAIFWRGRGWERWIAAALVPPIVMAHPLGLLWLLGAAAFIGAVHVAPPRYQFVVPVAAVILLLLVRHYLSHHFEAYWLPGPFYQINGTDQLRLYGSRYNILARLLLWFTLACLLFDVLTRRREPSFWKHYSIPVQLYALAEMGVLLLPTAIFLPQFAAPVTLLVERLSTVSAVLGCCLLGAMQPRKWHLIGFAAIGLIFFSFLYLDTAAVNSMEQQAEQLVGHLPPGQRVVATIWPFPGSRVVVSHVVDRACIGRCFSYSNYEPSSGQFRVRARLGNPVVAADARVSDAMQAGVYIVQAQDLPMFQIFQCSLTMTELCMRQLAAGERNGQIGVHPVR